jgi:peroxiredoxin Q/BCP
MEGQGFRDDFKSFEGKNVQIFGVSLDNEADNKAFAEKFSFPYPLLCDVNREIALGYQAVKSADEQYAARITYVIGEDGKILESIENVDTRTHSKDLCSRL